MTTARGSPSRRLPRSLPLPLPLQRMLELGQSPWLDSIGRTLFTTGELQRMVDDWGVRGVTSNPALFEQAIARSGEYDEDIAALAREGHDASGIVEALMLADVAVAADLFLPLHRDSGGHDGFVSVEVSPHLADDAAATVAEARRLWAALARPNVMIKVPGTDAGLEALRQLLAEGLNINVTLLFSVGRYRRVLEAWMDGIESAVVQGRSPASIASVASFFLSRIDARVDPQLDRIVGAGGSNAQDAAELRGRVSLASATLARAAFVEARASPRMRALETAGARPQRLLWASTGTKDPAYPDTRYVDTLVAAETVTTMPVDTLRAFADHGDPQPMAMSVPEAERVLRQLEGAGIDLQQETRALLDEGLAKFVEPYDALLATVGRSGTRVQRSNGE